MKFNRGQWLAHFFCLLPLCVVVFNFFQGSLTANPIQYLTIKSGRTAINLLIITLMGTPLKTIFGLSAFISIRKITGIYALFYALMHFFVFAVLDFGFRPDWMIDEIRYKPFLQIGLVGLVILIVLGITSLNSIKKVLKNFWKPVQRTVYLASGLGILHHLLAVKGDLFIPLLQFFLFAALMLLRLRFVRSRMIFHSEQLTRLNQFLLSN